MSILAERSDKGVVVARLLVTCCQGCKIVAVLCSIAQHRAMRGTLHKNGGKNHPSRLLMACRYRSWPFDRSLCNRPPVNSAIFGTVCLQYHHADVQK
jgi:hypothetical protein